MNLPIGDAEKMEYVLATSRKFLVKKDMTEQLFPEKGRFIDIITNYYDFVSREYEIFNNEPNLNILAELRKLFSHDASYLIYTYLPMGELFFRVVSHIVIKEARIEIGQYVSVKLLKNLPMLIVDGRVKVEIFYYSYYNYGDFGYDFENIDIIKNSEVSITSLEHRYRIKNTRVCYTRDFVFECGKMYLNLNSA